MKTLTRPKVIIRSHCARCTYPGLYGLVVTHKTLCAIFGKYQRRIKLEVTTAGTPGIHASIINQQTRNR